MVAFEADAQPSVTDPLFRKSIPVRHRQWTNQGCGFFFLFQIALCLGIGVALRYHLNAIDPVTDFLHPRREVGSDYHSITPLNDIFASIVMVLTAVGSMMCWIAALRLSPTATVYGSLLGYCSILVVGSTLAFYVSAFMGVALLLLACVVASYTRAVWRRAQLEVVFIREGAIAIFDNPILVFGVLPMIAAGGAFAFLAVLYSTSGTANVSSLALAAFTTFGMVTLVWLALVIRGIEIFTVAFTISGWYFSRRERHTVDPCVAVTTALTKQFGTIAAGCLNRRLLIDCAMHGDDFRTSTAHVAKLFMMAGSQAITNTIVSDTVSTVGAIGIVMVSVFAGYAALGFDGAALTRWLPTMTVIAIIVMAIVFTDAVRTAVNTIFVSYVEDVDDSVQTGVALHCSPEWHEAIISSPTTPDQFKNVRAPSRRRGGVDLNESRAANLPLVNMPSRPHSSFRYPPRLPQLGKARQMGLTTPSRVLPMCNSCSTYVICDPEDPIAMRYLYVIGYFVISCPLPPTTGAVSLLLLMMNGGSRRDAARLAPNGRDE